ncbi:hypothetical protein E2P64_07610 [Candidatus Bathyarchaeota archaeon]|nr:hypothetical protein E2P64_07610 [Candidatus Bathyarchaeota archaeon]
MGWLYTQGYDKKDQIRELLVETETRKVLDYSVRGSRLWVAFDITSKEGEHNQVIVLFLLAKDGNSYGYKDIDETMGPFYYDCPLKLLAVAPDSSKFANAKWRANVREHWAAKKVEKERPVETGCQVRVKPGWKGAGNEFKAQLVRYRRRYYVTTGNLGDPYYPRKAVERIN